MIVSLSVTNFRSFHHEETFSMVASKRLAGKHEDHTIPIPDSDERLLRVGVLYGANGAGKSNLFKALRALKTLALNSRGKGARIGRPEFKLASAPSSETTFDLRLVYNDKLYRFGLSCNDEYVVDEWLIQLVGARERPIYSRTTNSEGSVSVNLSVGINSSANLQSLASIGGPANQSFLATALATLEDSDLGSDLSGLRNWFVKLLNMIEPTSSYKALGHRLSAETSFRDFASDFLRSTSTGVDHLEIVLKDATEDDLKRDIPEKIWLKLLNGSAEENESRATVVGSGTDKEYVIDPNSEHRIQRISIHPAHRAPNGRSVPFDLKDESDGTQRLLNLIPTLHRYRGGPAVFFIDEVDRSLHPILVRKFVEFFLKSCVGEPHQIIVTTHESTLLDLDLLRRDEIWFADKDKDGQTHLYSLSDYKVRNDLEIRRHYLQGRFGAIPFLGNLDRLLEDNQEHSDATEA